LITHGKLVLTQKAFTKAWHLLAQASFTFCCWIKIKWLDGVIKACFCECTVSGMLTRWSFYVRLY
jgi:hypothetical protein